MDLNRLCLSCMEAETVNGQCPLCGIYNKDIDTGDSRNLSPGTILHGQYFIGKTIGKGGFGITYIAYDLYNNRKVAIKEYMPRECCVRSENRLNVEIMAEPDLFRFGLAHFTTEARILHQLRNYEGIVHVEKLFSENNTQYFAMEYLNGMDLAKYISNQPEEKIPWREAVDMMLPVLDTLDIIHRNNLIHRDISPDNLFICENNVIKLIDFGAASADFGDKSMTSKVILKRGYAPIEQYSLGNHTARIDIYALGSTLYSMITGVTPPESTSRHPVDNMKDVTEFCPSVPKELNGVLKKAMAVMPENRFASASEFKSALIKAIPHPDPIPPPRSNRPKEIPQSPENPEPPIVEPCPRCSIEAMESMSLAEYLGARIYHGIMPVIIALISIYGYAKFPVTLFMAAVPIIAELAMALGKWSAKGKDGGFRLCTLDGQAPPISRVLLRIILKYIPYWFGAYASNIVESNIITVYMAAITAIHFILTAMLRRTLYDIISGCCIAPYQAVPDMPYDNKEFSDKRNRTARSEGYAKFRLTCTVGNLKGMMFDIDSSAPSYTIGRNPSLCDITVPVDTPGISGRHCRLKVRTYNDCPYIELEDLNSTFGTYLNGEKILPDSVVAIGDDDKLKLGNSLFIVNILNYMQ